MKPSAILLAFFLFVNSAVPQSYIVEKITPSSELIGNSILDIEQDSSDYIWVASLQGVSYFDGMDWHKIRGNSNYTNDQFLQIEIDKNNVVWALANDSRLHLFKIVNNKLVLMNIPEYSSPIKGFIVAGFSILSNNGISVPVVAIRGVGISVFVNNKWRNLSQKDGLPTLQLNSIIKRNNEIYICHSEGISRLDSTLNINNKIGDEYGLSGLNILSILFDDEGKIEYFRTKRSLYKIENGKHKNIARVISSGNPRRTFNNFVRFDDDIILFASDFSLYIYRESINKLTAIKEKNGLTENGALNIFVDREHTIWIGKFVGISKIPALDFVNYSVYDGLVNNDIASIEQYNDSLIILGSVEGFTIFNINDYSIKKYEPPELQTCRINEMIRTPDGKIWIAAGSKGLFYLEDLNTIITAAETDDTHPISSVNIDKNGRVFFSNSHSLIEFNPGKNDTIITDRGLNVSYIRRIYFEGDTTLLCTSGGLFKSSNLKDWKLFTSSYRRANNLFAYYSDKEMGQLVGGLDGIYKVVGDSLVKSKFKLSIPVYFIKKDKFGDYWFGSNHGVYRLLDTNLINYDNTTGFIGLETNRDAFYSFSPEINIFGAIGGFSVFRRSFDRYKYHIGAKVKIKNAFAENVSFDFDSLQSFDYTYNDLTFNFYVFTSKFPKTFTFYTKLDGLDNDWIKLNEKVYGTITYRGIKSGEYVFNIKAVDQFGNETPVVSTNKIIIMKPFYQQFWFVALVSLLFISLIYLIIRLYLRNYTHENIQKELQKREEELFRETELFRHIFHNNKSVFILVDKATLKIMDINKAGLEYYGYKKEEINGKYVTTLFAKGNAAEVIDGNNNFLEFAESIHKLANNELRYVEMFSSVIQAKSGDLIFIIVHDITEEIEGFILLEETEKLYRSFVENMQEGLFMIKDGKLDYVNNSFARMLGYMPDELVGKNYLDLVADNSKQLVQERYEQRRRGEDVPNTYELSLIHKSGKIIIANLMVSLIELGGELFTFGTLIDITESHNYQKELKESELRYKSLFENNTVGMYRTTPDGRIEMANKAFVEMMGFDSVEEIISLNIEKGELYADFDKDRFMNLIEKDGIVTGFETKLIRKDGSEIFVRESAKAFYDEEGKIIFYEGVIEDITQLKLSSKEYEMSEKKLNLLLDFIADPIFEISLLGTIIYSRNDSALGKFYERENFSGQNISTLLPEDKKSELYDTLKEITGLIVQQKSIYYEWKNKDEAKFFQMRIMGYDAKTAIVVIRDITERREYEKRIIETRKKFERANRMKQAFLIQITHEIRTPLYKLNNYLYMLKQSLGKYMTEKDLDYMRIIQHAGERITDTVESITKQAELTVHETELNKTKFNLYQEIKDRYLKLWEGLAIEKNLTFSYKNNSTNPYVYCDIETTGLIFRNIVKNSFQYTSSGKVEIEFFDTDEGVKVKIQDTGIGIDKDFLEKVFEPFEQEEIGYTRSYDGIGLGLSIVKICAELNNIQISLESKKEKGTIFYLLFKNSDSK